MYHRQGDAVPARSWTVTFHHTRPSVIVSALEGAACVTTSSADTVATTDKLFKLLTMDYFRSSARAAVSMLRMP